ncbi:MAG: DegT/DnrJ/EryC1/StrS family aminotransferase [bacterium]|nr:DegT/DnrJ/EryC1/StrS family aminotransferase [bacterium]
MKIPLLNLKRQYELLQPMIESKVLDVLHSAQYILGHNVLELENRIAEYCETKYAVSCANGTDALILALKALGVGLGDEVITTPFTFFATAEAISIVGANPVFVDVEPDTYNIDSDQIESKLTRKTKAIMPVHIFGQPANMGAINKIAKKYNLYVIEDACQSIGANYQGKKVGSLSDIACFSFFPTKNLGCAGDGGVITTDNQKLADTIKSLRVHGSGKVKYYNYLIGQNSRLDELQAAILLVKLNKLDTWNHSRIEKAAYYTEKLKDTSLILPHVWESSVFHLYIVQSDQREAMVSFLLSAGISTGTYYPVPLHQQIAYKNLGYTDGSMPVSEHLAKRTFALPLYPELIQEEQDYIIQKVWEFENK